MGGYIRYDAVERKRIHRELRDEGLSQRDIAERTGVGNGTVARDLAPDGAEAKEKSQVNDSQPSNLAPNGADNGDVISGVIVPAGMNEDIQDLINGLNDKRRAEERAIPPPVSDHAQTTPQPERVRGVDPS